jgi:hypothetical protein
MNKKNLKNRNSKGVATGGSTATSEGGAWPPLGLG